ncbi:hypothetical protein, partial [Zoogloea sp.]|uniref:hypothetical protein n=1 Tax=Zoogloea sp. TaxID=49181 RepID=UPI002D183F03
MKVADLAQGKDNNFNLIRILAAYAVLIHHAFPLALGPKVVVPLEGSVGIRRRGRRRCVLHYQRLPGDREPAGTPEYRGVRVGSGVAGISGA